VLQVYVSYPDAGLTTPQKQLRGFKKAHNVSPGSAQRLDVVLDKYSFSLWDEARHAWRVNAGRYEIHIGFSCDFLPLSGAIEIPSTFYWNGL
jgi:beta-glucosidase